MLFNSQLFSRLSNFKAAKVLKKYISFKYKKDNSNTACKTALKYYDSYYKSIFQKKWPSIRLGLLSEEKQVAVINNLVDEEEVINLLESQGAFDLKCFLESQKSFFNEEELQNSNKTENSFVNKAIQQTIQAAAKTEWDEIYPSDKNVSFRSNLFENTEAVKKENSNTDESFMYDPEEADSSLEYDVSMAQIDESRLIMPSSKINSASSLYEFVPVTKLRGLEDYISETEYYKYYKAKDALNIAVEKEYNLDFPERLKVYCFDRGDFSQFHSPKKNVNNVYNYLLMNGADLLPVLALNVLPGETVLDMIPNSGTEAFCIFQSFICGHLKCISNKKTQFLFNNYVYNFSLDWKNMLSMTSINWKKENMDATFNKILLNVICSDDRESVTSLENNYFFNSKKTERLLLPSVQCDLLVKALKMVKENGVVVYTTKVMCPIQNDGVVGEAIKKMWEENKIEFYIKDISPALNHTKLLFKYANFIGLKYGTLVIPFLPSNFGPRYIAKIVRAA